MRNRNHSTSCNIYMFLYLFLLNFSSVPDFSYTYLMSSVVIPTYCDYGL